MHFVYIHKRLAYSDKQWPSPFNETSHYLGRESEVHLHSLCLIESINTQLLMHIHYIMLYGFPTIFINVFFSFVLIYLLCCLTESCLNSFFIFGMTIINSW